MQAIIDGRSGALFVTTVVGMPNDVSIGMWWRGRLEGSQRAATRTLYGRDEEGFGGRDQRCTLAFVSQHTAAAVPAQVPGAATQIRVIRQSR